MAKLPKRRARPGERLKTRGLWVDKAGNEHELVSGEHERDYQAAQAHAYRLDLVPNRAKMRAAADVELKFAMRMRREGIDKARIVLNNKPCEGELSCDTLLPAFLPENAELTVYGPNEFKKTYRGERDTQWPR